MQTLTMKERVLGALMGAAVGDALGVPHEFKNRSIMKANPATQMDEYGLHKQPKGTWSDDTSMMLGVAKALTDFAGQDLGEDLIKQMTLYFRDWLYKHEFNANGRTFDSGLATNTALDRYSDTYSLESPLELHGVTAEDEQGNGSLMRLLPLALWNALHPASPKLMNQASEITHAQPHLLGVCAHYIAFVERLMHWAQTHPEQDFPVEDLLKETNQSVIVQEQVVPYTPDIDKLLATPYEELRGEGFVLWSLQVTYWCITHAQSFKEATLLAVNVGMDTDTNASLVGGLMGFMYGLSGIPSEWLDVLRNKTMLLSVYEPFTEQLLK